MRIIILIVLVIFCLTAVACSSEAPSPADTQTASQPTPDVPATVEAGIRGTREAETAIDATVEAKVAATLTTSASAPGPTYTSAAAILSLDVYLTLCAPPEQDLADDATYGKLSSELAAEADRLEAITPPAQLSEWHLLNIENYRTMQAVIDTYPKDDVIDLANLLLIAGAADELEGKLGEVVVQLPEDVLQQMTEAGCIDPDVVPYDQADSSDEEGDDIGNATAIRVGASVLGALDYDGDIDYFGFQAQLGHTYEIDVTPRTLDDPIATLYDVYGSLLASNDDHGDTYASRLHFEASSSGEHFVAVEGYGTGTYTLTVSSPTRVNDHEDTAEDGPGAASDRAALVALHNATQGGSWKTRTNWLSGRPLHGWHGVTTGSDGRVTGLNLSSNYVKGALPAALGDLTNLESLRLWDNQLTGRIPAELGDLTNLRALNLGGNGSSRLTGPIPAALGDLTNLESLVLNNNELSGPIPATLGHLYNLRELDLWGNELTGPVPAWLYDLPNLQYLSLGWNELTGPVPAWLGDLSNLVGLVLTVNELTGPIPAELGKLSNLKWLDLSFNNLTGPIPASLADLSNLKGLSLRANQLTGCVPVGLRDVAEENDLGELDLLDCGLEGHPTAGSFDSVSAGEEHTCGVMSNGSVACWGWDEYGEATPPAGSFDSVSAGVFYTCGVRSNGSVACWGSDYWNGDYYGQATPPAGSFDSVSAGGVHTCGVRGNGSVACWGENEDGQATPPGSSSVSISAGGDLINDHGNDFESATRLAIGEGVGFELQYHGQEFVIVLRARAGAEYVFTLNWESYSFSPDPGDPGSMMALYDASGRVLARLNDYDFSERRVRNEIAWRAVNGGDHYIVVGNEYVDGTFAFSVTER